MMMRASNPSVISTSLLLLLLLLATGGDAFRLIAHFSQHGVSGTVTFHRGSETEEARGKVVVTARLSVAEEYAGEYSWGIYQVRDSTNNV